MAVSPYPKPIDNLIAHLKGTNPYGKTETLKLYEALKTLSDSLLKIGAIKGTQIANGTVGTSTLTIDLQEQLGSLVANELTRYEAQWSTNIVFSATDADTVAWTSGTIQFFDGTSASIASGNTGNMSTLTYIVYRPDVSNTVLQVYTSYTDVVGDRDRILMCVANKTTDATQKAFYIPAIGTFGINETVIGDNSISTAKIQALAITTGLLSANAVTAAKINVASLSAIGISAFTIAGEIIQGATIRTASSGTRIELDSTNGLRAYSGSTLTTQISISGGLAAEVLTTQVTGISANLVLQCNNGTAFIALQNTAGNAQVVASTLVRLDSASGATRFDLTSGLIEAKVSSTTQFELDNNSSSSQTAMLVRQDGSLRRVKTTFVAQNTWGAGNPATDINVLYVN